MPELASELIDPRPLLGSFQRDLYFPRYRPTTHGPWSVRAINMVCARGYWGDVYPIRGALIMLGPSEAGSQSWMSMLPSEIESQEIGLSASRGHTVVLGLGMGWLAANVALRPEVERVSVVERDADVLALVQDSGVFEQLPRHARKKICLYHADALDWRADAPVDTIQADIWRRLLEDGKLATMRRIQQNLSARHVYFWGQEMEIWRFACRRAGALPRELAPELVSTIVAEDLRLPLILPRDLREYGAQIVQAAPWWTPSEANWWS